TRAFGGDPLGDVIGVRNEHALLVAHKNDRAVDGSYALRMLAVHRSVPEFHGQVELDAVAGIPCAVDRGPCAGAAFNRLLRAVDADRGSVGPARDTKLEAKAGRLGWLNSQGRGVGDWKICVLFDPHGFAVDAPGDLRRNEQ